MRGARSWPGWVAAVIVLLAAGLLTTTSSSPSGSGLPPLSAHSSQPDGALALYLWTHRLRREVGYLEYRPFELGVGDSLLVSLQPQQEYEPDRLAALNTWLRGGGSLLLATDEPSALVEELGLEVPYIGEYSTARPAQPLLLQPPVERVTAESDTVLALDEGVPLLVAGSPEAPALAASRRGTGRVWVFSMPAALTNDALMRDDNWKVYLNVLANARPGRVLFDEYHHGRPEVAGLRGLILERRWGWALLYTAALLLVYLALRGRRLGRPISVVRTQPRNSGEYVRSLASLLQSSKQLPYLTQHYRESLSRSLRQAAALPPGAELGELRRAAEESSGAPAGAISEAIQRLDEGARMDEQRLLQLVQEAERERQQLARRRPL